VSSKQQERRQIRDRLFTIISKMDEVERIALASDNEDLLPCGFQNFHQSAIEKHYTNPL